MLNTLLCCFDKICVMYISKVIYKNNKITHWSNNYYFIIPGLFEKINSEVEGDYCCLQFDFMPMTLF